MLASKGLWPRLMRLLTVVIIILTTHCMSNVEVVWISEVALILGGLRRALAIVVVVLRLRISGRCKVRRATVIVLVEVVLVM